MAFLRRHRRRSRRNADYEDGHGAAKAKPIVLWIGGSLSVLLLTLLLAVGGGDSGEQQRTAHAHLKTAVAHRDAGNIEAAVVALKNALQKDPDLGLARELLGELYLDLGDGASAEKELVAARDLGMDGDRYWLLTHRAKLLRRQYGKVLTNLEDGPVPAELAAEARFMMGQALVGLGRESEAVESFAHAIELRLA